MVGGRFLLGEDAPRSQGGLISPKGIDSSAQGTTLGAPSSAATFSAHLNINQPSLVVISYHLHQLGIVIHLNVHTDNTGASKAA